MKRLFSLLLVVILLFSNSQVAQALTDETILHRLEYPVLYPNDGFSYPDLTNSAGPNVEELEKTVDIDEFREHLINGFASCPQYIEVEEFKIPYSDTTAQALREYIWYETPELFHIYGLYVGEYNGYVSYISASYRYTAEEYASMYTEFKAGSEKLLQGIKNNNGLTDVEKALLLHDRLAVWCEYDYARLQAGTMPDESYSAYGVFAKKTAVCMGYALAYDYLLLQVGIDSYYCSSDTLNHAWNIVYINDSKYHVDVTWDDPVWDISGQVYHNNFLRSTAGIISTKHNATDYDSSPIDTTFDNYYWQNSTTAFQLVGEDIYYIDNTTATLNRISNGITTACQNVSGTWRAPSGGYWVGNFSQLSFDGENLLYSLPNSVYKYDIKTGISTPIFTPDMPTDGYYSIYGLKYEDCKISCEIFTTPNFDETTKSNYTKNQTHHVESDWKILNAPTPDAQGLKQKTCINCNETLEEKVIPAISVTEKDKTVIDYSNSLIFTDVFTCQDINNLVAASGTTTVSVESSDTFYGTGTLINVLIDGEIVHTLTLIINGDINGDSVCDVLDLAQAQLYASNKKTPEPLDIYAANCGIAETIDETTYQNLVNKALNI